MITIVAKNTMDVNVNKRSFASMDFFLLSIKDQHLVERMNFWYFFAPEQHCCIG